MSIIEIILLSVALSMDAFSVSICKGLSLGKENIKIKYCLSCGLWFGFFQALMPLIGYLAGRNFAKIINQFDHWVAFILLVFLGVKMIKEAITNTEENIDASFSFKNMLLLAFATSIDALAVGISFAMLQNVNIVLAVCIIGIITFIFSFVGVKLGNVFGMKFKTKAEIIGGVILILIGVKILFDHIIK